MELTIRLATEEELDGVAQLVVDAYAEFAAAMSPDAWAMFARDIANVHGRKHDGDIVVAVDESGEIVGTVTMFREWRGVQEGTVAIRLLAVLPDQRNQGIGTALVRWVVEEARASNKGRVVATVMKMMDAIREIVERDGFVRMPELDHEPAPGVRAEGFCLELS
ncbi:GNAT family N-acetyltransferase [Euzebya tangerina]|uniref:GNAT family N-acetyltransferase n=1 Tax=Euzebya tangerina TaxID=591198 RepID=UPI000E321502|nr:GNAT family N-acetyltransferase [Euzebya tangerina]